MMSETVTQAPTPTAPVKAQATMEGLADKAAQAAAQNMNQQETPAQDPAEVKQVIEELLDLDKLDKFRFQGQELTPEELNRAFLRHSDYTKKTQEISKERKYIENLYHDLQNVKSQPDLAEKFKEIYPERYHQYLDMILDSTSENKANKRHVPSEDDVSDPVEAKLKALEEKLEQRERALEQKFHDEKVEAMGLELNSIFNELTSKYDLADEDAINNRAMRLIEENRDNPNFRMTKSAWERLFRQDHEAREKRYMEREKKRLGDQVQKGRKAMDSGPGGGSLGHAKKKMSLEEAREFAIQDLEAKLRG